MRQITRRAMLATTAALPTLALPAIATPAMPGEWSPIRHAFEQWKGLWAAANEPGIGDDECDRRTDICCDVEQRLYQMPARDGTDLAMKVAVLVEDLLLPSSDMGKGFGADARHMLEAAGIGLEAAHVAPAAAETEDPAVEAARRWVAASSAEETYAYDGFHGGDWDDDPHAAALSSEERRLWQAMLDTPPTTPEALALMLACCLYRIEGQAIGSHFSDPDSWYFEGTEGQGTFYALLPVLWNSPAAAKLFPRTSQPVDPERLAGKASA